MGFMLDTNVLLDILTADKKWLEWSTAQFRRAAEDGPIPINPIIYTELAAAFDTQAELDHWLRPSLFKRLPLPYEVGFKVSRAFLTYRRSSGTKRSALPDFFIGAHAEYAGYTLITRDVSRYRTYFPKVKLICPGG